LKFLNDKQYQLFVVPYGHIQTFKFPVINMSRQTPR